MNDIHTHLFWDSYDADRDAVIRRAREAGVRQMICVGTSPEDNPQAIALAEQYADIYASVGLHPHFFNKIIEKEFPISNVQNLISELKELAKQKKVVAIGECGLDYFIRGGEQPITDEQKIFQKEGFLAQIALAQEAELPIIIHTRPSFGSMPARLPETPSVSLRAGNDSQARRSDSGGDAYEDMYEILKNHLSLITHPASHFVLHCYQGDTAVTKKFLELPNIYFSFSGSITYPVKKAQIGTKDDSAETVKLIPLDRLFVETDCPFLAPQEKRGTRNEPAYVSLTAEAVCRLKECSLTDLEHCLVENWKKVFGAGTSR